MGAEHRGIRPQASRRIMLVIKLTQRLAPRLSLQHGNFICRKTDDFFRVAQFIIVPGIVEYGFRPILRHARKRQHLFPVLNVAGIPEPAQQ